MKNSLDSILQTIAVTDLLLLAFFSKRPETFLSGPLLLLHFPPCSRTSAISLACPTQTLLIDLSSNQ